MSATPGPTARPRLLLTGASTRAAAASASRAGFDVIALDGYADRDQAPGVDARAVNGERFSAAAAAAVARDIPADVVAYLSPFENHPDVVARLAAGRTLWGNSRDTLRQVRDPHRLAATLRAHGFATARLDGEGPGPWLLKPRASGGGHGIRPWTAGEPVPPTHYVQERIDGASASIVFVANGVDAVVLGLSHQLIGVAAFGAGDFRYVGNLLDPALARRAARASDAPFGTTAQALAATLTRTFGLVGLNGIDVLLGAGGPAAVEVNPRWSASMELVERATGVSLIGLHADACRDGRLPAGWVLPPGEVHGKAILYARRDLVVGDTDGWLASGTIADVPHAGTRIPAGAPICTLLARGATPAACRAMLEARAAALTAGLHAEVA